MKAITVRQPWAWAIIHAGKDVENRGRNIAGDYRGPLAIHSSGRKSDDPEYIRDAIESMSSRGLPARDQITDLGTFLPFGSTLYVGCVLGVVDLVDVHWCGPGYVCSHERFDTPLGAGLASVCCSKWGQECSQHLVLANPRPLRLPLQIPGHLGLWELPDHLLNGRW